MRHMEFEISNRVVLFIFVIAAMAIISICYVEIEGVKQETKRYEICLKATQDIEKCRPKEKK